MRAGLMFCGAVAVLALGACSGDKTKTVDDGTADTTSVFNRTTPLDSMLRPIGRVERMQSVMGRLRTATDSQMVTMDLYAPPEGFPLRFTTYKSGDMQVSSMKVGGNASITFTPLFGGKADPHAFIQLQFDTAAPPATDASRLALEASTTGVKRSGLSLTPMIDGYPWATRPAAFSYNLDGRTLEGMMLIARRGPQTYRVFVQYPTDMKSAMETRLKLLLNQWRWEDDYTYMVPAPPLAAPRPPAQPGDSAA